MSNCKHGLLAASSLASLVLLANPAIAQDQTGNAVDPVENQDPNAAPATRGGLSEIVVTARKRAESVQDVPVAVTAISEEAIATRDITSVEKIAAIAPQFNVGRASNGSGAQLTLRGIGSSSTSIGIEQSVAVVVDGAYYGQGRIIQEGFFDLERVEVLKGPQALFFGKNATAGVIAITSKSPEFVPEFNAKAGYEFAADQWRLEAGGSVPLSDQIAVRIAARYSKMNGGLYDNISVNRDYATLDIATGDVTSHTAYPAPSKAPGEEEFLTRGTLLFEPNNDLTITLKAGYDHNTVNNSSWNYVAYACGLDSGNSQLTGYPCTNDFVTHQNNIPADIAPVFPLSKEDGSLFNRYESANVTGNIAWQVGNAQLTSVTNYQWNNNQWACACDFQSSDGGTWATEDSSWKAFSQELRLLTQFDGPLNFMIGGLYQDTRRDFDQYIMFANLSDSTASPENEFLATTKTSFTKGETFAIFGQMTYKIMPDLELAAGARYTDESKDSYFAQPYNNAALTGIFRSPDAADGLGEVNAKQSFKDLSPEVTLTWNATPDVLVYGAYKTAYKSGGFSNGGINSQLSSDPLGDLTFDKETAEGFELGIKSTILDNQLRLNLTAFNYDYSDLQIDFFSSAVFAFQTLTADARTRGVEVEFEYAPYAIDGLNLHGSINYTDAQYTKFPEGPCYAGQTAAEGCSIVTAGGGLRQNLTGATLSVAPEWTGNLGVAYDMPVGTDYMLGFSADARYSDSYLPSAFNNPLSRQDSYVTLDAGIRFGAEDKGWELAVIGKNLTNEFYVTGVVDGPSTPVASSPAGTKADQLGFGTLPRTVMVQASVRF